MLMQFQQEEKLSSPKRISSHKGIPNVIIINIQCGLERV